ncbi:hypothetical protein O181_122819 [Austropuccinia psidii MF-1]|uniref:Uncharacterized protein n=1 Tax=Austropuccinia psidii MF-1 TaxID=1389203 RepID=A0A9Q3KNU1_9BASI|nr:hypothetical protein [Austropuccinia psidii MF-1]
MHTILKDPVVVHIWYNIPLCTIFSQQSNGDTFLTILNDSKLSTQSITTLKEDVFSYSVWQFPGGYQKTIQVPHPPRPAGVGLSFPIRTILREILRGNQSLQSFSRYHIFSIPWTTQLVHGVVIKHHVWPWPNWANSVPQFSSQDGQDCIGPIEKIRLGDSPSRISLSAFHIYWPPFITWRLFPQLINILELFLSLFSFTLLK